MEPRNLLAGGKEDGVSVSTLLLNVSIESNGRGRRLTCYKSMLAGHGKQEGGRLSRLTMSKGLLSADAYTSPRGDRLHFGI